MILPPVLPPSEHPRHGKILVVDDEEALVRVLARVLTNAGYEVETAVDGGQAIQLLAANTFDAIVSDIAMPRMNGIQLLQLVRQGDSDVPVILMTGAPHVQSATDAVSLGALGYLTKPIDSDELTRSSTARCA